MKTFIRELGQSIVISNARVGDEIVVTLLAQEDGKSRLAVTGPLNVESDTAEDFQTAYMARAQAEVAGGE